MKVKYRLKINCNEVYYIHQEGRYWIREQLVLILRQAFDTQIGCAMY